LYTTNAPQNEIYRKRKCVSCGHIFYTTEFEVDANDAFLREFRDCCNNHKRNYRKTGKKIYAVYLRKNDELVAFGTADECADRMGMTPGIFRTTISRAINGKTKKYEVCAYTEEELGEEQDE
jgi:hypothetical protein